MSIHACIDFLDRVQSDAVLRGRLEERFGNGSVGFEALAEFAVAEGFDVAARDFRGELDDAALDRVAGGIDQGAGTATPGGGQHEVPPDIQALVSDVRRSLQAILQAQSETIKKIMGV